MILNIDIDGVLYPFHQTLASYIESKGRRLPANWVPHTWKVWEVWGMSEGEWRNWFRKGVEDGVVWRQGKPIGEAQKYLWKFSDEGHEIQLITHRLVHNFAHGAAIASTVAWLDEYNIPYRSIVFAGEGMCKGMYQGEILVDDNARNVNEYSIWQPDATTILFLAPWNVDVPLNPGILEAGSMHEVYNIVQRRA